MRNIKTIGLSTILLGSLILLGTQCLPNVSIEEKLIELAVGSSITAELIAEGELNVHDDIEVVDIADSLDLRQILDDAGIDYEDLKDIKLAGVAYRVTKPDPQPDRRIENATVTVMREGGAENPLVTAFSEDVNAVIDWKTAPLDAAGVAVINGILADLVAEIRDGTPATNTKATFHVIGTSVPGNIETDFVWELKIIFTILGQIRIDMVSF